MKYIKDAGILSVKKYSMRTLMLVMIFMLTLMQEANAARAKQMEAMTEDALLPRNRIIGYYGNFLSKRMGVLGEYPQDQMLSMLKAEMRKWAEADPDTPTIPAIEYIAVVAQKDPGVDGRYRARMSDSEIQKAIAIADRVNGIVILDIQVGLSDLESEIPRLERYLKMPNVMLGIDPEFSMPAGKKPGKVIGTVDARDINFAIRYLAQIVREYNLPPKILVVHRFTKRMVTNHGNIRLVPEVQVVMDMDGWGPQTLKKDSYRAYIAAEPVQYTGIKLFYKNDLKNNSAGLLTPEQIMKLDPVPMFILFQ
jgi:hypothetical protein